MKKSIASTRTTLFLAKQALFVMFFIGLFSGSVFADVQPKDRFKFSQEMMRLVDLVQDANAIRLKHADIQRKLLRDTELAMDEDGKFTYCVKISGTANELSFIHSSIQSKFTVKNTGNGVFEVTSDFEDIIDLSTVDYVVRIWICD